MVILRNCGARSAPRNLFRVFTIFHQNTGFLLYSTPKNNRSLELATVLELPLYYLSVPIYLYCLLSAILPLSAPQLLCGARSGMRAAQWPGGRAARGRARASAARRPNLVQASVGAVRQLVALRRCGAAALWHCGAAALRRKLVRCTPNAPKCNAMGDFQYKYWEII